jgi:hypothetical protein
MAEQGGEMHKAQLPTATAGSPQEPRFNEPAGKTCMHRAKQLTKQ